MKVTIIVGNCCGTKKSQHWDKAEEWGVRLKGVRAVKGNRCWS